MKKQVTIGPFIISNISPTFIIAEAGVNHNGELSVAKKLVDLAAETGANAVKFQSYITEEIILENAEKAPYQKTTTEVSQTQFAMLKSLEIDKEFHTSLVNYCAEKKILFLSTPYDEQSLLLLDELNIPAIKIASTDVTNLLLLEKVAALHKPVILSTGMSDLNEIRLAYECLTENGCKDIILLKCTSNYPTPIEEVNLAGIETLASSFPSSWIGFSDHTQGVGASPYAVALGAKVVEKHFTLDKNLAGPDHRASLSPEELKLWIVEIRKVEQMLGSKEIHPTPSETDTKKSLQKCLVAKERIPKNTPILKHQLIAKRTGGKGIPASKVKEIIGAAAKQPIAKNQIILPEYIQ